MEVEGEVMEQSLYFIPSKTWSTGHLNVLYQKKTCQGCRTSGNSDLNFEHQFRNKWPPLWLFGPYNISQRFANDVILTSVATGILIRLCYCNWYFAQCLSLQQLSWLDFVIATAILARLVIATVILIRLCYCNWYLN